MANVTYVKGNGRNAQRVTVDGAKTGTIAILKGAGFTLEKPAPAPKVVAKSKAADPKDDGEK